MEKNGHSYPLLSSLPWLKSAAKGEFDELLGRTVDAKTGARSAAGELQLSDLSLVWQAFFEAAATGDLATPADFDQRLAQIKQQIQDNGVTYNVYAESSGPQRAWAVDLFPLIISPDTWAHIETGVIQRVRVLERLMADMYGPQTLLREGLIPAALVQGNPGYLREMHGVKPAGGHFLHLVAFDMARGPDGLWWVVGQRTQAPSGLGYLLENRLAVSRQFPSAFESLKVQRLASTYRALIEGLKAHSPAGEEAHIALLTPGPYSETYFEHAYLARYLGLTLVEGNDLTVRDQHLFLKTVDGLMPVHGLLKRLDDEYLDPLELRPDSSLGVPGLLQAIRAGHVLVANMPGSAFLESPALLGFLPALAEHLIGEELQLPAVPTWWCGEPTVLKEALAALPESVIKPTFPFSYHPMSTRYSFTSVAGQGLSEAERNEWAERIRRQPDEHTIQSAMPWSALPIWKSEPSRPHQSHLEHHPTVLRVFAVRTSDDHWRVLPGGMARIVGDNAEMASMQRGGGSADVWVQTHGVVDQTTLLTAAKTPAAVLASKRVVTSRSAENLFWLGRYTERSENTARLAKLVLISLNSGASRSAPLMQWLNALSVQAGLVLPSVPSAALSKRVFERTLINGLSAQRNRNTQSVGFNLRALRSAADSVRERLSPETWSLILQTESSFEQSLKSGQNEGMNPNQAIQALAAVSVNMAAITGAQTDRMTRDNGWRLMTIGRQLERMWFLSSALQKAQATGLWDHVAGFEALLALFDSTITFRAQFQQSRELLPLLSLLVMAPDNPRALACVCDALRRRVKGLTGSQANGQLNTVSLTLPDPSHWTLEGLVSAPSDEVPNLVQVLKECQDAALNLSDSSSALYFTHSLNSNKILGA